MDLPAEESDDDAHTSATTTTHTHDSTISETGQPQSQYVEASQENPILIGSSAPSSPRTPSPAARQDLEDTESGDDADESSGEDEEEEEDVEDEELAPPSIAEEFEHPELPAEDPDTDTSNADAEMSVLDRIYSYLERDPSPYVESDNGYGSGDSGRVRIDRMMQGPPTDWGSRSPSPSAASRGGDDDPMDVDDQAEESQSGDRMSTSGQPRLSLFHRPEAGQDSESENEDPGEEEEAELSDPADDEERDYPLGVSHIASEDEGEDGLSPTGPIIAHDPETEKIPKPSRQRHKELISDRYVHGIRINPYCSKTLRNAIRHTKRHDIYTHDRDERKFPKMHTSAIGSVVWKADEKDRFFDALALYSPDQMRKIAAAVETKTELECSEYHEALKEGFNQRAEYTGNRGRTMVHLWDIPAAYDFPEELVNAMDWEALKIEKKVVHKDMLHERGQWGMSYNIDEEMAAQLDKFVEDGNRAALDDTAPEAELLNVSQMLQLSEFFFMNGPGEANYRTIDPERKPSIWYNALIEFNEIVRGITRRLVAAAIYEREVKVTHNMSTGICEEISREDVHAAAQELGMKTSAYDYWITVARRNKLRVVQKSQEMYYADPTTINYEQAEGFLHKLTLPELYRAFGSDALRIRLHKQAEEDAAKKAWESVQPQYPPPPPERKSLKEDPDDDSWIEYDDERNEYSGGYNMRKFAAKEDQYHAQVEAITDLADSFRNAQRVQWQWLRAFGRRKPLQINHSGGQPKFPKWTEGRYFSARSDWREKAYFKALRLPLRRKMTLEEKIQHRKLVLEKATADGTIKWDVERPWCWSKEQRGMPTWLPVWVPLTQQKKQKASAPEPPPGMDIPAPAEPYDYAQGKWVGKLLDPVAERRACERRLRRMHKLASEGDVHFAPPLEAFPLEREKSNSRRTQGKLEALERNLVWQEKQYRVPRRPLVWGKTVDEPGQDVEDLKRDWRVAAVELNRSLSYYRQRQKKVEQLKLWWEEEKEKRRERKEAENVKVSPVVRKRQRRAKKEPEEVVKASPPVKAKKRDRTGKVKHNEDNKGNLQADHESAEAEEEAEDPPARPSKRKKAVARKTWLLEAVERFEEKSHDATSSPAAAQQDNPDDDEDEDEASHTPIPPPIKHKKKSNRVAEATKRRLAAFTRGSAASKRSRKPPSESPETSYRDADSHHTESDLEAADYLSFIASSTPKPPHTTKARASAKQRKDALAKAAEESRVAEEEAGEGEEEEVPTLAPPQKRSPPPEWSAPAKRRRTVTYGSKSTSVVKPKSSAAKKRASLLPKTNSPPVLRSPRKQRQRWQAALPAGFVSTVDADLEEGEGGEGDGGGAVEGVDKEAEAFLKGVLGESSGSEFEAE